ncbi:hypothetical protein FRC10_008447 [Ceratobasidium sp. 414]|nr:hypothetical protein FRC10_008447 [Ceratobasidium sp. 414]
MVFQSQILYKPEHSGHNAECIIVYFYESTNIRGRELVKNFADLPIPSPKLTAPENKPFQHIEGPANQLEWLADVALSSSCPFPTPPSSSTTSPQPPTSTSVAKLAQRRTPRAADSTLPLALRASAPGRPKEGNDRFSFWRYKDSSKLRLGMAESIDDVPAPMKLKRRSIEIPAASGPTYYYVWNAKD